MIVSGLAGLNSLDRTFKCKSDSITLVVSHDGIQIKVLMNTRDGSRPFVPSSLSFTTN